MFKSLFLAVLLVLGTGINATEKIIVGIAGGTASGKTTLAQKIKESFSDRAVLLCQDAYYKDFSRLSIEEKSKINFDHPDSLDFTLLKQHILDLREGKAIGKPTYDFVTHSRLPHSEAVMPAQIILVEGILLFAVPEIRNLFDVKIFIDTDDDIRVLRRIERDIKERGRDFQSVCEQYTKTVKPMHDKFVGPSKQFADVIVLHGAENPTSLSLILCKLKEVL